MTDFDDELLSAVIDGEATDEEAARVEADPALAARLAELREAREAIAGDLQLPSAAQRDAAIAIAVDALPATPRTVVALRDRRRRRALQGASIAAAVLVVLGIIGGIAALSGHQSRQANSSAAGTSASSEAAPSRSPSVDAQSGAATAGTSASELGTFATPQALVDVVRRSQTLEAPAAEPQGGNNSNAQDSAAASRSRSCESGTGVRVVGRAELSGQPVTVIVVESGGQQTVQVLDVNCVVVFTQPL
jgi:hypothetical protein